jgi:acetyltransferase-like isoleucine patch superfamily enzyme
VSAARHTTPVAALARLVRPANWLHAVRLVNFYGFAHVEQRRKLTAGPGLRLSPSVSLRNAERITLGREVHVGERSCLWAGDSTGSITLGDNALLGPEVFITASNYQVAAGTPVMHQAKSEADVVIGADVWLGVRVTVLPGVTIGDGAVVGAGSVVSKSLPANCIAVGAPARVVAWRPGSVEAGVADADAPVVAAPEGGPGGA